MNTTNELWTIIDKKEDICYSRGGSSSKSKLLVYSNKQSALKNPWTKQIIDEDQVEVKQIYNNEI